MRIRRNVAMQLFFIPFMAMATLCATGCTADRQQTPGRTPTGGTASPSVGQASSSPDVQPPPPSVEASASGGQYRVSYGWAVPTGEVAISHPVHPPISQPPSPPLPYLVGVYVGDHPEGNPAYQRISFYFRGALPGYRFGYVPKVLADGSGAPVTLIGNAFIRIVFVDAQAHDNAGASTVRTTPRNPIGMANLKSYATAGDFEGHVTYGLGVVVAAGSDQVLPLRAGELIKPDGSGGTFYVIHLDVRTG